MGKGYGVLVCCLVVIGWLPAAFAGEFEGILHMKTTHPDPSLNSTSLFYLKGDMARFERPSQDSQARIMILDGRKHSMTMLMPDKKVAMEFSLENAGTTAEHMQGMVDKTTVERTGKTEQITGYTCEICRMTDKDTKKLEHEVCVAKGFGKSASFFLDPKQFSNPRSLRGSSNWRMKGALAFGRPCMARTGKKSRAPK
jgi:Domain of unknown function (DUF4412)